MPAKRTPTKAKPHQVFGQAPQSSKMFRAGLHARVSANDQQTVHAMREYTARRGWTIAIQVRAVGSKVVQRQVRETLLKAARHRDIKEAVLDTYCNLK
jgi:hypothetical protein